MTRQPTYPPDGPKCPTCDRPMWFVRGKDPRPWDGAHYWCRCGRMWVYLVSGGELVPYDPAAGHTMGARS